MGYLLSTKEILWWRILASLSRLKQNDTELPDMLGFEAYVTYAGLLPKLSDLNLKVKKQTLRFRL